MPGLLGTLFPDSRFNRPGGLLGGLSNMDINEPLLYAGLGLLSGQNWQQGFGNAMQGIAGGLKSQRARRKEQELAEAWKGLLGGQGTAVTGVPGLPGSMTPPMLTGALGAPVASQLPSPFSPAGGAAAAAGRGPLDMQAAPMATGALDPTGRDLVVRTVLAEAGNQGPEGMAAVANVIRNRTMAGRFGGSPADVVQAKGQFEPWGTAAGRARIAGFSPESDAYKRAAAIVDQVFGGQASDPTRGATHFYAPALQAQLGRQPPSWARNPLASIGGHQFFAPEGAVAGGAPQALTPGAAAPAAPAMQGGQAPQAVAQSFLAGLAPQQQQALASIAASNPAVAGAIVQRMLGAQQPTTEDIKNFSFARQNGFTGTFPEFLQLKKTGQTGFTLGESQERYDAQGRLIAKGPPKSPPPAPAGYRWTKEGNLEAIAGGPATKIEGEQAGRLALAQNALRSIDKAGSILEKASGTKEWLQFYSRSGDIGRARRDIRYAIEAGLRMMTGAAAPDSEVAAYEEMFMPLPVDTPETVKQKVAALKAFMQGAIVNFQQGRVGVPAAPTAPPVEAPVAPPIPPAVTPPAPAQAPALPPAVAPAAPPQQQAVPPQQFPTGQALPPEAIQRLPLARTPQEARRFPSGTIFRDPQGNVRRVP